MSDSSILVDQSSAIKLRQTEEMLRAFQEQSEMYRTMKSCLCDCIRARERKATEVEVSVRQIPADSPKHLNS